MIKDIFISDESNNLLIGPTYNFPFIGVDTLVPGSDQKIKPENFMAQAYSYPTGMVSGHKYSHLRINNVVLSIMFTDIDNFTATKFLVDLQRFLETKLPKITTETVKNNYFLLLDLLKSPETVILPSFHKPRIFNENVFINIVQSINYVQNSENQVIKSKIFGEVFLDHSDVRSLKVSLQLQPGTSFKTPYPFVEDGSSVIISGKALENRNILSFQRRDQPVHIKMEKSGNAYTFRSEEKTKFKFLEFKIPVGMNTYRVDVKISSGEYNFDMSTGMIYWRFNDAFFDKEEIKINLYSLSDEISTDAIVANFKVEDSGNCPVKIDGCVNNLQPSQKFWARSTIQCQSYVFQR